MDQQAAMLHSAVFVTACVLMTLIGVYLRCVLEARKGRRAAPINAELVEKWTMAGRLVKQALWVVAPLLGPMMLVFQGE
ncbi:MAG: hypothetical protein KDI69_06690 [Xanthomonadales bacterium]|nr:hypothetical protein [Xanthomonadales bacterium]